ncbi:MAG: ABC transporter ATP-binding protein [Haloarcula sp.]
MSTTRFDLSKTIPCTRTLVIWAAVLNAELILILGYVVNAAEPTTDPFLLVFPFIWMNVAALVFIRVRPAPIKRRQTLVSAVVALGYLLVLGYVGGVYGTGGQGTGFRLVTQAPPGFSPTVVFSGATLSIVLIPWKVAGYLALAYLVFVTVLDASGGAVGGVLGLFSCVSCVLPVIASILGGFAGVGATLSQAALSQSYGLSTAVFILSVGLLYGVHRFDVTLVGHLRS